MPTLDSLPADRRAIIELVLRQAKPYAEISDLLGLQEARVQAYARESLAELAPRSARRVDEKWRDPVADYLLGQLSASEAAKVRNYMAGSEPARAWSLSVVDSLGDLYAEGTEPEIPEAGAAPAAPATPTPAPAATPPRRTPPPRRPSGALSPAAQAVVLRRRIVIAVAATLVIGLIAFFVGPGFKGKPPAPTAAAASSASNAGPVIPVGALELKPETGETGQGVATFLTQDGKPGILVQAKMAPNAKGQAYEVWLYNDQGDATSIGAALTDKKGNYVGTGPLPTNFGSYKYIDISREDINDDTTHSGDSVLRGSMSAVQPVDPSAAGGATGSTPAPTPPPTSTSP
ncbi:MAG: hypothetical protein QOG62_8 [Thermoleophilaceae bacterium]|nr:hypothetical protein [Thermoleophilaceae bacterium]